MSFSDILFEGDVNSGEPQSYSTRIMNSEMNILPLRVLEALYIEKQRGGTSINEKNEYRRGALIRLRAERSVG